MGNSGWDDGCLSPSSGFSDMVGDSVWSPKEVDAEVGISSEKFDNSSCSAEEVNSKESVVDGDEESKSGKGSAKGKYKCSVCGVQVLKPSLLKQHMSTHSEDKPIVCPVENCGRSYKRQDHLNRHSLSHQGKLFSCSWEGCDRSFTLSSNLQRHLRLHAKWNANLLRGPKAEAGGRFPCPEPGCGSAFKYPSLLMTHTEHVHGSLQISQAACLEPGCGEIFNSLSELKVHTRSAHYYLVCETCGLSISRDKLKAHARQHGGQVMRCTHPGCLHSYNKKSNLNTHIRAVHMDLKPYACSHSGCEMRFAYKAVRDNHEKCSVHVKPVGKGDFENEDLKYRLKPHGGRRRVMLYQVDDLLPQKRLFQPLG